MAFSTHPCFDTPDDSTVVWRYINFSKLISLLSKRALFFSRLRYLENDPWEGYYPKLQFTDNSYKQMAEELKWDLKNAESVSKTLIGGIEKRRNDFAVSCWTIDEHESDALWRIYAPNQGVAIKSTVGRLKLAIRGFHGQVYIGKINYLDYNKEIIKIDNGFWPTICKRMAFSYERELRLVTPEQKLNIPKLNISFPGFSDKAGDRGELAPVDVMGLVEKIVIGPNERTWFLDAVKDTITKFGVAIPVASSSLSESPGTS